MISTSMCSARPRVLGSPDANGEFSKSISISTARNKPTMLSREIPSLAGGWGAGAVGRIPSRASIVRRASVSPIASDPTKYPRTSTPAINARHPPQPRRASFSSRCRLESSSASDNAPPQRFCGRRPGRVPGRCPPSRRYAGKLLPIRPARTLRELPAWRPSRVSRLLYSAGNPTYGACVNSGRPYDGCDCLTRQAEIGSRLCLGSPHTRQQSTTKSITRIDQALDLIWCQLGKSIRAPRRNMYWFLFGLRMGGVRSPCACS